MPGFNAIGRLALGRASDDTTLVVAAGAFAFTGIAATFKATLAGSTAAYALTGNAAAFSAVLPCNAGSFALSGRNATLASAAPAATAAFVLSPDVFALTALGRLAIGEQAEKITTAYLATFETTLEGAGQSYALTGSAAAYSYDFNRGSVGSSLSGGTFSRGRWRKLVDDERERRAAARRASELAAARAQEAKRRAEAEANAARAAARSAEDAANAASARQRAVAGALAAVADARRVSQVMQDLQPMAMAARAAQRQAEAERADEEAAIRLLLAA